MKWMLPVVILVALWCSAAYSQAPADANQYVSREEYNKLKEEMNALRAEMMAMRKERAPQVAEANQVREVEALKAEVAALKEERTVQSADVNQSIESLSSRVEIVMKEAERNRIGDTKFLLTGYGFASYTDRRTENSTFSAGFNPIFLWELSDQLLFESEIEFELTTPRDNEDETGTSETETSLEYADMTYILNDYMTVGAGKFLLPLGIFNQYLHPAWINKLPDRPLPYDDEVGIIPEAGIGAFIRGAVPYGETKWNYALYICNGPALITDDPDENGMMDFDNFDDNNHNKAVGGRIGFLPIPELEVGYSIQAAQVAPPNFEDTDALFQVVDFSYTKQISQLRGTVQLLSEWAWSDVDNATYPDTPRFDNDRRGYYIQAAYRPTMAEDKYLKNLEFVLRYDSLYVPDNAPGSADEFRWTPGIDYWITPSAVVKVAYQFDEMSGQSEDRNALLLQTAIGF
jgi:hypothetical protein